MVCPLVRGDLIKFGIKYLYFILYRFIVEGVVQVLTAVPGKYLVKGEMNIE